MTFSQSECNPKVILCELFVRNMYFDGGKEAISRASWCVSSTDQAAKLKLDVRTAEPTYSLWTKLKISLFNNAARDTSNTVFVG